MVIFDVRQQGMGHRWWEMGAVVERAMVDSSPWFLLSFVYVLVVLIHINLCFLVHILIHIKGVTKFHISTTHHLYNHQISNWITNYLTANHQNLKKLPKNSDLRITISNTTIVLKYHRKFRFKNMNNHHTSTIFLLYRRIRLMLKLMPWSSWV